MRWKPLVLGLIVVAGAVVAARRWPRSPAPLLGVVLAVAAATVLGWHEKALGTVSLSLPPFAGFTWGPADVTEVLPAALGLAFVASVNILITSRVVEHFQGRHRPLRAADADAELGAYGIANLCAGVFGAPLSVGIPARSLANLRCGGTTRLSNLLHAVFLLMLAGFGAGLIAQDSAGGPGRRDGLRGPGPPGMEHLAAASPDAPARCRRVPRHRRRRALDQRRRRRGHRLLVLCHPALRLRSSADCSGVPAIGPRKRGFVMSSRRMIASNVTFFKTPADFRKWLEKHHATAQELWVGFHKKGSGKPSITWPESVDEALCVGWIDGIRKSVDETSYTIRFTRRKPGSIWSAVNIKRARS